MNKILMMLLLAAGCWMGPSGDAAALPRYFSPGYEPGGCGDELVIAKVGQAIGPELQSRLLRAFKAQFGANAQVESIELMPYRNAMWLVFQSGDKSTRTIALKLDEKKGAYVWNPATSVVHTCTGNPCSYCRFSEGVGCYCNQGGASNTCNHTMTSVVGWERFMAVLDL